MAPERHLKPQRFQTVLRQLTIGLSDDAQTAGRGDDADFITPFQFFWDHSPIHFLPPEFQKYDQGPANISRLYKKHLS